MNILDKASFRHFIQKLIAKLNGKANDNQVVKLTGDQTVNGRKRFKRSFVEDNLELVADNLNNANLLTLHFLDNKPNTAHAARYISFYLNKVRTGFLGYASSNHSDFSIVNSTGGLVTDVRGALALKTNGELQVNANSANITLGPVTARLGNSTVNIGNLTITSTGEIKLITNGNLVFEVGGDIRLSNQRNIKNVANPRDRSDVSTKAYTDDLNDGLKNAIKGIVQRSADYNTFRREVANW